MDNENKDRAIKELKRKDILKGKPKDTRFFTKAFRVTALELIAFR